MTKTGWMGSGSLLLCALLVAPGALGAAAVEPRATQQRVQLADLFGESDEEKAARAQKEQNQDDAISAWPSFSMLSGARLAVGYFLITSAKARVALG